MIICFTGIDGSGKTMQAERLVARLNQEGHAARYVWTGGRAYLTRPLVWLAKRLLRAPRLARRETAAPAPSSQSSDYASYLRSTRRLFKRKWVLTLWQHISLLEHTIEILVVTLPHLLRGRVVVCDRYIYDSLLGIAVLAGSQPEALAQAMQHAKAYPVPTPKMWFLIDLPAEVAFARRTDVVDVAFLEQRVPLYQAMAATLGAQRVDGTQSIEAVAACIWQAVARQLPQVSNSTWQERTDEL